MNAREAQLAELLGSDTNVHIAAQLSRILRMLEKLGHAALVLADAGIVERLAQFRKARGLRSGEPEGGNRLIAQNKLEKMFAEAPECHPQIAAALDLRLVQQILNLLAFLLDDRDKQPFNPFFSTDGKTIYFTLGGHEADIWLMELGKK